MFLKGQVEDQNPIRDVNSKAQIICDGSLKSYFKYSPI